MGGAKQNGNGNGNGNGKKKEQRNNSAFKEESAEFIIIALLLADQLRFESILVDREGTVAITLKGKVKRKNEDAAKKIADFLEENGEMTIDDAIEGLRQRLYRK